MLTLSQVAQQLTGTLRGWAARHGLGGAGAATPEATVRTPSGARIRRRRGNDLRACSRLLTMVAAHGDYPVPRPESFREWLTDPEVVDAWVAESRGEILGHVAISRIGSDAATLMRWREVTGRSPDELVAVSRLFVRQRVRRQGIATSLLAVAVEESHARGLLPVAEVISGNGPGVPLLERSGWRLVGMSAWGPRKDALEGYLYAGPRP